VFRALSILLLLVAPLVAQEPDPGPPGRRVLLVDIDDVGWDLVDSTPTPTLDGLTASGRRFTRFHSSPLCSPTRARGLLGAYGSRPELGIGTIIRREAKYALPLEPFVPLPRLLVQAGRSTAKVGKWHLAPDPLVDHPQRAGFEHYSGVMGNATGITGGENYFSFRKVVDGKARRVRQRYLTSDETDDALRFVGQGVDFVWISYHAVHKPFHQPPSGLFAVGHPLQGDRDHVGAMLMALDHELGRLLEGALEAGYTVLVVSDNGSPEEIDGGKGQLTQAGVIVPAWAVGPGIEPGEERALVDWVDLYATVAELLEVPCSEANQGPDSISFAPLLFGRQRARERAWLYADRWKPNGRDPRDLGERKLWARALRDERWTLIVDEGERGRRFYDRATDPEEAHDLLTEELSAPAAEAYARLRSRLGIE
jgi:arylsulfatase B